MLVLSLWQENKEKRRKKETPKEYGLFESTNL